MNGAFCPRCNGRLPEGRLTCHPDAGFVLYAAASYATPAVRGLLHALKYDAVIRAADPLAHIALAYLGTTESFFRTFSTGKWIGLPMPLSTKKARKRGFNQAERLLFSIAERASALGYAFPPVRLGLLARVHDKGSQTKCRDPKERAENVADAFSVSRPEAIHGTNILLLDDVFTSGATMREAVRILKRNGARRVLALVVAKA